MNDGFFLLSLFRDAVVKLFGFARYIFTWTFPVKSDLSKSFVIANRYAKGKIPSLLATVTEKVPT